MSTTSTEAQAAMPPEIDPQESTGTSETAGSIAMLYDLSLPVTVELGRTKMSVQEVLELSRGSVVELDRLVGEPVDIYAGDRRFAEGEVVVIGEQFGVRITRILAQDRPGEATNG